MFASLLIANRGEIACRILRSARALGMRTIAVYSEADANALHVRSADEAVCIGPASARESYLRVDRIIDAARARGAQAIHPGYGFLSESAHFAQACAQAGIAFVGPPVEAIRTMGSKSAAKSLLQGTGVPLTPGYHGARQDAAFLAAEAMRIGYPILIKASAGGGGKGMRRVDDPQDFAAALAACQRESLGAFGSDQVLLEKYLLRPRHIEVQIFADQHGNCVHLFERDCSVQRRHQKVLEEAPAPGMSADRRAALGTAAVQVARAVGYVGAGTVEFIVPQAGAGAEFYFMEMNTRLQVEHPVTEMITGHDLVQWQLRVAAGEALPCSQEDLQIHGHAIEARLYAEDADNGFAPSTGSLVYLRLPEPSVDVRIDAGVAQGDEITPHYDPMIAKIIAWGIDREGARARLHQALEHCHVVGVRSNAAFLARLVQAPSFAGAILDTELIERDADFLAPAAQPPERSAWLLAALAYLEAERCADERARTGRPAPPWGQRAGWRVNSPPRRSLLVRWIGHETQEQRLLCALADGPQTVLVMEGISSRCQARWDGAQVDQGQLHAQLDGSQSTVAVVRHAGRWHVLAAGRHLEFAVSDPLTGAALRAAHEDAQHDTVLAPMPGKVIALLAQPGSRVAGNAPLLIVEAMKMEHTVRAPQAGVLRSFLVDVGEQVAMAQNLAHFEVDPAPGGK